MNNWLDSCSHLKARVSYPSKWVTKPSVPCWDSFKTLVRTMKQFEQSVLKKSYTKSTRSIRFASQCRLLYYIHQATAAIACSPREHQKSFWKSEQSFYDYVWMFYSHMLQMPAPCWIIGIKKDWLKAISHVDPNGRFVQRCTLKRLQKSPVHITKRQKICRLWVSVWRNDVK